MVWIVFFFSFQGATLMIYGLIMAIGAGMLGGLAGHLGGRPELSDLRGMGALGGLVLEGLGLTVFHIGLLTLVACYGLWTSRIWGLRLARGLAIAYTGITLVLFMTALVTRAGILATLVGLVLWGFVVVYLFGDPRSSGAFGQYYTQLRSSSQGV